jgi:hypothetical protein
MGRLAPRFSAARMMREYASRLYAGAGPDQPPRPT